MLFHMDANTHFYWLPVIRNSYVAVDFFFVLSGFVIASAYGNRLRIPQDARRFALRRFGRLYPLHIAVLGIYIGIELGRLYFLHAPDAFTNNTSVPSLFANLFLVQGFTPDHETWNYPAWSISVELWANFAFAVLAVSLGRRFLACSLLILAATGAFVASNGRLTLPVSPVEVDVLLDAMRSIFGFLLGTITFALFDAVRRRGWKLFRAAELLVLPLIVCAFGYTDVLPDLGPPLVFSVVVFLFAFEVGPLSALLKRPACLKLGASSYSIYLTHSLYLLLMTVIVYALARHLGLPPSISVGGDDLLTLGGRWTMDGAALLCVSAAIMGSVLTYRYIEEPARIFFNRLSDSRIVGIPRIFPIRAASRARR